jgi:hypothetical protein
VLFLLTSLIYPLHKIIQKALPRLFVGGAFFRIHQSKNVGRAASRGLRPHSRRAIRSITFAPSSAPLVRHSVATVVPLLSLSLRGALNMGIKLNHSFISKYHTKKGFLYFIYR